MLVTISGSSSSNHPVTEVEFDKSSVTLLNALNPASSLNNFLACSKASSVVFNPPEESNSDLEFNISDYKIAISANALSILVFTAPIASVTTVSPCKEPANANKDIIHA